MSPPSNFSVANYSIDGDLIAVSEIDASTLTTDDIDFFAKKFRHLSGDLELPLEGKIPGEVEFLDFRIGSDLNGAYVLYYFHDEVVFASLLLSGTDHEMETELMQVFKFLLLDTQDEEEPTEEEIDEVLSSEAFDFETQDSLRPIVFDVQMADMSDEIKVADHVAKVNHHLAAAFFAIDRSSKTKTN